MIITTGSGVVIVIDDGFKTAIICVIRGIIDPFVISNGCGDIGAIAIAHDITDDAFPSWFRCIDLI